MHGYAAALYAQKPMISFTGTTCKPIFFVAENEEEAHTFALAQCRELFSTDEGYTRHKASVVQVDQNILYDHVPSGTCYQVTLTQKKPT